MDFALQGMCPSVLLDNEWRVFGMAASLTDIPTRIDKRDATGVWSDCGILILCRVSQTQLAGALSSFLPRQRRRGET